MNITPEHSKLSIEELISTYIKGYEEIQMINVSTEDGFSIAHTCKLKLESDAVAAMTSSLSSISDAATIMLDEKSYSICILEAGESNIFFVKSEYQEKPCIITSCIKDYATLGKARFIMRQIGEKVKNLTS